VVDEPSVAWSVVSKWGPSKNHIPALPLSVSPSLTQPKEVGSPKINIPNKNLIHPSAKSHVPSQKRRAALPTKSEVPLVETEVPPPAKKPVTLSEKEELPLPDKKKTPVAPPARKTPYQPPKVAMGELQQNESAIAKSVLVQPKNAVDDKPCLDKKQVLLQEKKEVSLPSKEKVPPPTKKLVTLSEKREMPLPEKKTSSAPWARLFQPPKVAKDEADFPPLAKTRAPPQKRSAVLKIVSVQPKTAEDDKPRPDNQRVPLSETKEVAPPDEKEVPPSDKEEVPLPDKEEVPLPDKEEVPLPDKEEVPLPDKEEVPLPGETKEHLLDDETSGASWARLSGSPMVPKGESDSPLIDKTTVPPQDGGAVGRSVLVQPEKAVDDEPRPEKTFPRSFRGVRGQRGSRGSRRSRHRRFPTDRSGPRSGIRPKEEAYNKSKPEEVDNKPKPPKPEEVDNRPKPVEADSKPQQEEDASGKIIVSLPATVKGTTPIEIPAPPNVEGEGSFDNKPKPEKEIGDMILVSLPAIVVGTAPVYTPVPVRSMVARSASLPENMGGPPAIAVGTFRTETPVPRRKTGKESASLPEEKAGDEVDSEAETLVSQLEDHYNVSSPVFGVVGGTFYTPIYGAARGRAWDRKKACWDLAASTSLSLPDQLDDSNRAAIDSHVPNVAGDDLPHPDAFVIEDEPELPSLLGHPAKTQTSSLSAYVTPT
jgi:hypothetical protein